MPTLVSATELRKAVEEGTFIRDGVAANAEDIKYDFRLSNSILKAKFGCAIDANDLSVSERAQLVVEPGEVVFVLSQENLALEKNMIAQLSPKRKMSQAGVLTLGGHTIDPGYEGPLLVGLFNFSSTPFVLRPGRKLVGATFYRLSEQEAEGIVGSAEPLKTFPDELVDVMQKYRPIEIKFLTDAIACFESEINAIKIDLKERDDWKERLDRHDEQIHNLLEGLKAEKEAREKGEDRFTASINSLESTFDNLKTMFMLIKGGAIALCALIVILVIPLIVQYLPKMLQWFKS